MDSVAARTLKLIAEDVLQDFGFTEVSILGFKYDVLQEAYKRVNSMTEYQALGLLVKVEKRIREWRERHT